MYIHSFYNYVRVHAVLELVLDYNYYVYYCTILHWSTTVAVQCIVLELVLELVLDYMCIIVLYCTGLSIVLLLQCSVLYCTVLELVLELVLDYMCIIVLYCTGLSIVLLLQCNVLYCI